MSNARRIGFMALALVSFWVLAWRVYEYGASRGYPPPYYEVLVEMLLNQYWWLVFVSLAFIPTVLHTFSVHNSLIVVLGAWSLTFGLLCTLSFGFICYRGLQDAANRIESITEHITSWLWLLLPIVLTTAFVIFGAWRQAMRDAEVEAVVKGE